MIKTHQRVHGVTVQKKKPKKSDTKSTDTKTEDEKEKEPEYEFEPLLYIHPDEDKFLIEGKPRWGEPIRDDTVKKQATWYLL